MARTLLNRTILSTVLAASTLFSAEAQVVDYGMSNGVFSFEDSTESTKGSKRSVLNISEEHAKLGTRSLEWNWSKKGAFLRIDAPVPYMAENPNPKEKSVSSFVFWVYSPEVIEGSLRFSFMKDGKECCHFDYNLGFSGWRGSWVAFERDMKGCPQPDMDQIIISAPEGVQKGRLFFDGIIPASFQDVRHHTPDWQAPFVNENTTSHWLVLNNSWKLDLDIACKEQLSEKDIEDIRTINDRFIELVMSSGAMNINKAREKFTSYGLRYNSDGTITGKPIYFIRYGETFLNLDIPDAKKAFKENGQLLRDLNDFMLKLAIGAKKAKTQEERDEFSAMYIELTRHLLDQGFAAGSGQGTLHHLGYSMRNFYTGPVLMQEELRKAGLAEEMQKAMEWFSGVGEIKVAPLEPGMDIDAFNTSLMGRVASILMLEDTPYKYAYLQALSRWIDNGMKHTEGLRACFKRDGSVVHHRKSYPAYATGGFTGAVNAVWMLSKTGLAISQESHQNLKDALLAMKFYCYDDKFPLAMSGRHPDGKGALIREHYERLALAGTPDGKENIDFEIKNALSETPQGTQNYGFNCSLSHRYGNKLVTIAGHSRYLWSAEIYNQANHYGRYLTHGSMQVGNSFSQEGWDWCHIPGTTAAVLPMDMMKANVLNVDEKSGYEEMLLSDEWFAGGVTHKGKSGAFAMILHEHDKYNGSLRARKSFFVIENRVICLGSDIENSLKGAPVHTTLFQNHTGTLTPKMAPNYISENKKVITSHTGELYIVKGAEIQFYRGKQTSLHEENDSQTEGVFEKAYINHGDIVSRGKYEYLCMLPCTKKELQMVRDPQAIKAYAKKVHYTVLRHDTKVHGVYDHKTEINAFAVFEQGKVDDFITDCSPAMVMYSANGEKITLSVSNPDLALYEGPSDDVYNEFMKRIERSVYGREWIDNPCGETTVVLTLVGEWKIADRNGCEVSATYRKGQTTLTFKSREARTEEITLWPK